jgi:enoyl-CoA hydratase
LLARGPARFDVAGTASPGGDRRAGRRPGDIRAWQWYEGVDEERETMPQELVSYRREGSIATITMDDGKRNALSPQMFAALYAALDRAEQDQAAVVLTGREQVLSAGFDLKVLRGGGPATLRMLRAGYSLTARLLAFPRPTVVACNGHALAMGAFLLLSCDYRLGVPGDYKYAANEVAIGLPMPRVGAEVLRLRLTPAAFQRATILAETFAPEGAREAGFIDRLVPAGELLAQAHATAAELLKLDMPAHVLTKRRVRAEVLDNIQRGLRADLRDAVVMGARQFVKAKWSRADTPRG